MGLTTDSTLLCDKQDRAALARIFLIEKCDITSFTAGSLQDFTAVTLSTTAKVWFQYEGEFESKSLNMEGENESGTATFTNTVEFKVKGIDKTVGKRMQELIDSRKVVAIIEGTNKVSSDKIGYVIGWDDIILGEAAAKPNVSGVIEGELAGANEFTIQLVAKHAEIVREFVGSIDTNSDGSVSFGS